VLVITGFGDEALRFTALSEHNTDTSTSLRDPELVEALETLARGKTTLAPPAAGAQETVARESVSAYLTLRVTRPARSLEIFNELAQIEGVESCDAGARGRGHHHPRPGFQPRGHRGLFEKVKAVRGVEVTSVSSVERPRIDREVHEFIDIYQRAVKSGSQQIAQKQRGTTSYVIVDIDPAAIQQIFTTVFFIDEVVFCDVIDDGKRLVG